MQGFGNYKINMIKKQKIIKKSWAYLFIFLVWFIFASPFFIKDSVPYPSTYQVNFFAPWSTYSELASPVKNNAMPDIISQIYPWKYLSIQAYLSGQIPFWNPYSFSGTPHLANYQSAVFSPFNLLFFILPFIDAWSLSVLLQPLLAGIFMFLLTRSLDRSVIAGLISSIAFMFCGFIVTWMGYATLGFAIIFLPLCLYGLEKFFQKGKKRYLILSSLTIPLSFFSGHFQISLYFLITVFIYILIKYLLTNDKKKGLQCLIYLFLGLLISMPQVLPSMELYSESLRSVLFQKIEAIPFNYLPTFLSPDFFGNPVTRNDWFGHYAEWNGYIGIIPFILAIYGISSKKNKQIFYLFIFSIFVLLLAFDTPLLSLFVALKIPVLSTSAASRIIVIFSFLFSLFSSFGYDQLINDFKNGNIKKIIFVCSSFFVAFVILWLVIFLKILPADKTIIARQNLILPSLIFVAFAAFAFISILFRKNKKIYFVFALALLIVTSFDLLRFSIKWMPFDPKNLVFKETETLKELKKMSGSDRFFGNLGGEISVYYRLPSVEGYDAVYLKRYGEFINYINNGILQTPGRSVVIFSKRGEFTNKGINLLGIRYFVHKKADNGAAWTFPVWEYKKDELSLIYEDDRYQIYENNTVLPRAFLVNQYEVLSDKEQILDTLFSEGFDFSKKVILEEKVGLIQSSGSAGMVSIQKYDLNKVSFSIKANTDSLLFLSDSYHSGWKAKVDGDNQKIYRADYVFRAVPVKKGDHIVEFEYLPGSFVYAMISSLLGILGLFFFSFPKGKVFKG